MSLHRVSLLVTVVVVVTMACVATIPLDTFATHADPDDDHDVLVRVDPDRFIPNPHPHARVRRLNYDTFVMSHAEARRVASTSSFSSVSHLPRRRTPHDKLSTRLRSSTSMTSTSSRTTTTSTSSTSYVVLLTSTTATSAAAMASARERVEHATGARTRPHKSAQGPVLIVDGPLSTTALDTLATLEFVVWVDRVPRPRKTTIFPSWEAVASGANNANANGATFNATGVIVGVLDTWLDTDHCAFRDTAHTVPRSTIGDSRKTLVDSGHAKIRAYFKTCTYQESVCYATGGDENDWDDHGTFVVGQAAGWPCNGWSGGVAPGARVAFVDLTVPGSPDEIALPYSLEAVFDSLAAANATDVSLSWGEGCDGAYDFLAAELDAVVYAHPEMTVMVAAGNYGAGCPAVSGSANCCAQGGLSSPATMLNAFSVGATPLGAGVYVDGTRGFPTAFVATNPSLFRRDVAVSFSSHGTTDGRVAPQIYAGGLQARSSASDGSSTSHDFVVMSGTSMAAPATGAASVRARLRQWLQPPATEPRGSLVRATMLALTTPLLATVDWLPSQHKLVASPSGGDERRRGRAMAIPASFWNDSYASSWFVGTFTVDAHSTTALCFATTEATTTVRVAVAWDSPPGSPDADVALVNPLFLFVTSDTEHTRDVSHVDNHKLLDVPVTTVPGSVRVGVNAGVLTNAPQAFSIAVWSSTSAISLTPCDAECSIFEPATPCNVSHGVGVIPCSPYGELATTCAPVACDVGYLLTNNSCVPEMLAYPNASQSCNATQQEMFVDNRCVCYGVKTCTPPPESTSAANDVAFTFCDPVNGTWSTCVAGGGSSSPPPSSSLQVNCTPPVAYWIVVSFWILTVVVCLVGIAACSTLDLDRSSSTTQGKKEVAKNDDRDMELNYATKVMLALLIVCTAAFGVGVAQTGDASCAFVGWTLATMNGVLLFSLLAAFHDKVNVVLLAVWTIPATAVIACTGFFPQYTTGVLVCMLVVFVVIVYQEFAACMAVLAAIVLLLISLASYHSQQPYANPWVFVLLLAVLLSILFGGIFLAQRAYVGPHSREEDDESTKGQQASDVMGRKRR